MNNEVKNILNTIKVSSVTVPNALIHFDGQAGTFLVYSPSNERTGLAGDDVPIELVESWDIDLYSETDYVKIKKDIIKAFADNGWVFLGAGQGTFDRPTKLYHQLLEFEKEAV